MIDSRDEFVHEFAKGKDFIDQFHFHFFNKKTKIFGFGDITYHFKKMKADFSWSLFVKDHLYQYTNTVDFDSPPQHLSDGKFTYTVIAPREKIGIQLSSDNVNARIELVGNCPIFSFPDKCATGEQKKELSIWNRYDQRCKINAVIKIADGPGRGTHEGLFQGQRMHRYGENLFSKTGCCSSLCVQIRDQSLNLAYLDLDGCVAANGFISKRSGNIPIQSTEIESVAFDKTNYHIRSTEFSYTDAQDDRDLMVSRRINSVKMPIAKTQAGKFVHWKIFSEFKIIGSNSKGFGIEDHFISIEKLKKLE